jgi:hypothetical protein
MDAARANQLRAAILRAAAEGLSPDQVVQRLGCSRSTVYKVLRTPTADARTLPRPPASRLPPESIGAIRRLAEAYPELSVRRLHALAVARARDDPHAPPVPYPSAVAPIVAELRRVSAVRPPPPDAPEDSPIPSTLHPATAGSPAEALRRLLDEALAELDGAERVHRFRLRQQAALIAALLARVQSARSFQSTELVRLSRALDGLIRDHRTDDPPAPPAADTESPR